MKEERKEMLKKVIKNNKKWPLIIIGVSAKNFPKAVVLPADTPSNELGVVPSSTGQKYPAWVMSLMIKEKQNTSIVLVIDGIDSVSMEEQEKFAGMLSNKGVNGYKFPENTQILLTAKAGSTDMISKRIKDLCLIFDMR